MSSPVGRATPPDSIADAIGRGVPPGSLRYFAVLFAAAGARPRVEALYAFEAELRRIVDAEAHEAAHARLQWWRGELDRLAAGRPTHPLAHALAGLREARDADLGLLHEMLVAADLDLARFTYRNWTELEAYCARAGGALQMLAAATLAGQRGLTDAERDFARRLGSAIRQVEMLRDLTQDAARGRFYAPLDALTAARIEPGSLAHPPADPGCFEFVDTWRSRVRADLASLPSLLVTLDERTAQRHGLVLAALHARLLERMARSSGVDSEPAELGPWTRLWTAWRAARRYA
jgi:phytoene synthase